MDVRRLVVVWFAVCLLAASGCQKLSFWKSDPKRTADSRSSASIFRSDALGPTKQQKREFMLEMAAMFETQGEVEQAIHAYEAVLEQTKNPTALHRLGVLWVRQGDLERATSYFEQALKHDPENAELYCDLGYALYLDQRYAEADQALRRALELNPHLARAHANFGMLLARTGRSEDALYAFSRAGLSEGEARNNLALAMMVEQRFPEAQAQYEGALRAEPNNEAARRGMATLQQVQARTMVR